MNTPDDVLNGVMTASEEGTTDTTDDRIILTIDERSRTIKYDGDLILGVQGDKYAERIYFRCPQYVYKDKDDVINLNDATTIIKIVYKNQALKEAYIAECAKNGLESDGNFLFSWFLSERVCSKSATVEFNVYIIDESKTITDADGTGLVQAWHTTTFKGKVLPALDVTDETKEEITTDTKSTAEIIEALNSYENELKALHKSLDNVNTYADEIVQDAVDASFEGVNNSIAAVEAKVDAQYTNDEIDEKIDVVDMKLNARYVNSEIDSKVSAVDQKVDTLKNNLTDSTNPLTVHNATNAAYATNASRLYVANDENSSNYPILFSLGGTNATGLNDIRWNSYLYVNPASGALHAKAFHENGELLSDKYASKDKTLTISFKSSTPTTGNTTTYLEGNATTDPYIDADSNTNTLSYVKYAFTLDSTIYTKLSEAKRIIVSHGSSRYRLAVSSTRILTDTASNGTGVMTRVQVNATYVDNVPGGTCLNKTYYFVLNMMYDNGPTANFTIYRKSDSKMTWLGISSITIEY